MPARILHFVGYGLIPGAADDKRAAVRRRLEALVAAVDGAELVCAGPNISASRFAEGWDYSAAIMLRDRDTLATYLAHEQHAALSAEASDGFYEVVAVFDTEIHPINEGE